VLICCSSFDVVRPWHTSGFGRSQKPPGQEHKGYSMLRKRKNNCDS
jgi:hypothetical protein